MRTLLSIPKTEIWLNPPMKSWHHGERVDPKNWPWWVLCKFSWLKMGPDVEVRHKKLSEIGRCYENICQPESQPRHFENCKPRFYRRFYIYTRWRAFDADIRIQ